MCIFCKIVDGSIPSSKLYEDENMIILLDISQVTKGHALVIPKKHYDSFLDCDQEILKKMICKAQDFANHMMDTLQCKGINLLSNANEVAGQSVPHFHLHLIPRYSQEDAIKIQFNESEQQDLQVLCNQLKR